MKDKASNEQRGEPQGVPVGGPGAGALHRGQECPLDHRQFEAGFQRVRHVAAGHQGVDRTQRRRQTRRHGAIRN